MEKYVGYEKKEFEEKIKRIYFKLDNLSTSLAMISQQLDGKRKNLDLSYIDTNVIKNLNDVVEILNGFEINPEELLAFDIIKIRENLEERAKEDLY